jgi:hypothetical protein
LSRICRSSLSLSLDPFFSTICVGAWS